LLGQEDPDAYAEFYDRHVSRIFSWSTARVGDYAADLTAEVFALAWQSRKRFRDQHEGSALPWLYGIAHNVLRASLRIALGLQDATTRRQAPAQKRFTPSGHQGGQACPHMAARCTGPGA
jgi:RNA polymerase sigma-70 factor (ECF subfamily)